MHPRPVAPTACNIVARRRGLRLRELAGGDVATLQAVFAGLSAASRYTRYLAPIRVLSPGMVRALTAIDGVDHLALAVERRRLPWRWEPVGLGRLVRTDGGRGEVAVEVVDAVQGRGVGTWLLIELARLAGARGFREIEGDVLTGNEAMRRVFRRVLPDAEATDRGATVHYVAPLPPAISAAEAALRLDVTIEELLLDLDRRPLTA